MGKTIFADEIRLDGNSIASFVPSGVLTGSNSAIASTQAIIDHVDNAISGVTASGGTTLTKWTNFLSVGGVSDGTSTGGTDNSAALQAAYNAAANNTTIYLGGNFRFNSPVTWSNNNKRVHLVVEGSIFTGNASSGNSFLIIDSRQNYFLFKGNINGKIIDSIDDFTGLTNVAIHLRHGWENVVNLTSSSIEGYQDAIRLGSVSSGSADAGGCQYNHVYFSLIVRCYRAIHFKCEGSTTSVWKGWANSNFIFGGCIACIEGVRFTKGPDQVDPFNQNYLYNLGFENNGFYPGAMNYGVVGEFCKMTVFQNFRMEGNKVAVKINLDNTCLANAWKGGFLYDTDLTNTGASATFECPIFSEADGRVIGNYAQGYPVITSPTYWNGRVKVFGTTRIPTMADNIPANVDVEWTSNIHATATSGTYTVPYGITQVMANGATAISTTNLDSRWDYELTVINIHGSIAITVNGYSLPAGQSCTIKNIAGTWRFMAK